MSRFRRFALTFAFSLLAAGQASALNWIESIDGDLSGDGISPTLLNFTVGTNSIQGVMGWDGLSIDQDIWRFTIAPGFQLTGITLTNYNSSPNPPAEHYIGVANAITIDDGFDTTLNLSNAEWIWTGSSVNLLLALDNGPVYSGPGFNGPLGAGDYSFLMRENFSMTDVNGDPGGNMLVGYTIQFVIAPVPEPGSATLLLAATTVLMRRRRRLMLDA
jgi:hypothetical protein